MRAIGVITATLALLVIWGEASFQWKMAGYRAQNEDPEFYETWQRSEQIKSAQHMILPALGAIIILASCIPSRK
jgi:hypothetical protein